MTKRVELDRRLTSWLEEDAAPHAPGELHARFIEGVETARQRPGWATTERWISMETRAQLGAVPRAVVVFATLALLIALTAGAIAIGAELTSSSRNGLIAYPHASGGIWAVQPDGSDPHVLVESDAMPSAPVWSPDGTKLAYWSESRGEEALDLMVSAADGSDPIVVASDVDATGWPQVDWSPDGTRLTYTARVPSAASEDCDTAVGGQFCGSRVFVAAADGSSGAVQVGDPELDARESVWSPDGSSIAFGGGTAAQDIQLHVMDADGSNVRTVSDLQGSTWSLYRLDWSADGSSVVGTSGVPVWDIWAFSVEDGTETNISGPSFASQPADRLFPAYAADGAIAWWGGWSGESCACLTLREGNADPVVLSDFGGVLAWSPDGQFLVSDQAGRAGELAVIDRQGQVQATITDVGGDTASWQDLGG